MLCRISKELGMKEVESRVAREFMDDGSEIRLKLTIDRKNQTADFDFEGTGHEIYGNMNAPVSITYSAIIYCLRCLVDSEIPLN